MKTPFSHVIFILMYICSVNIQYLFCIIFPLFGISAVEDVTDDIHAEVQKQIHNFEKELDQVGNIHAFMIKMRMLNYSVVCGME